MWIEPTAPASKYPGVHATRGCRGGEKVDDKMIESEVWKISGGAECGLRGPCFRARQPPDGPLAKRQNRLGLPFPTPISHPHRPPYRWRANRPPGPGNVAFRGLHARCTSLETLKLVIVLSVGVDGENVLLFGSRGSRVESVRPRNDSLTNVSHPVYCFNLSLARSSWASLIRKLNLASEIVFPGKARGRLTCTTK